MTHSYVTAAAPVRGRLLGVGGGALRNAVRVPSILPRGATTALFPYE